MRRLNDLLLILLFIAAEAFAIGDADKGELLAKSCVACHGTDGNSPSNAFPKIAGQHAEYLFKQLQDFKTKKRDNALMAGIVMPLSVQDMEDLSVYYSKQIATRNANAAKDDKDLLALGHNLYYGGNIKSAIPACSACHGQKGNGLARAKFPKLSGQHSSYTKTQLKLFRQASLNKQMHDDPKPSRSNDNNKMMRALSAQLTDKEINALSEYISALH